MRTTDRMAVEYYSGYTYAEEPRAFVYKAVAALRKIWREPPGPCFEVLADDGGVYRLVYDEAVDEWQALLRS